MRNSGARGASTFEVKIFGVCLRSDNRSYVIPERCTTSTHVFPCLSSRGDRGRLGHLESDVVQEATGEGRKSGETMDAGHLGLAGRVHDI
jgi:hypothetical protein